MWTFITCYFREVQGRSIGNNLMTMHWQVHKAIRLIKDSMRIIVGMREAYCAVDLYGITLNYIFRTSDFVVCVIPMYVQSTIINTLRILNLSKPYAKYGHVHKKEYTHVLNDITYVALIPK